LWPQAQLHYIDRIPFVIASRWLARSGAITAAAFGARLRLPVARRASSAICQKLAYPSALSLQVATTNCYNLTNRSHYRTSTPHTRTDMALFSSPSLAARLSQSLNLHMHWYRNGRIEWQVEVINGP